YSEGRFLEQGSSKAYLGDYEKLLKNPKYKRANILEIKGQGVDINIINENITVWIYIRAVDKIINVSPLINYIRTSKSEVGNFSFSINPVIDLEKLIFYSNEIVNFSPLNNNGMHYADFFETYLQKNDVVFIKFEQLEIEKNNINQDIFSLDISKDSLKASPERLWDMIGLIDEHSVNYIASSTDKVISVNGRDLMKVLSEDGSYFLSYKFIEGKDDKNKMVWGTDTGSSWFRRNMISGEFNSFFSYEHKSIENSLTFIINHLSNLGITPDNLWESYGEDITKVYSVKDATKELVAEKCKVSGIWRIIKLGLDEATKQRVVTGESLINPNGTMLDFFNSVCQNPFIEFFGDTYTDTFDFIVRQPPFNKSAIQGVVNSQLYIEIEESNLLQFNLGEESSYYSHFQISPKNQWQGMTEGEFEAIIPIIFLPQYAEVFGNRRFYIDDMYMSRVSIEGNEQGKLESFIQGILNDYVYCIDSKSYLPFTRTGSVTINGDRRIKRGGFIYLKATDEIFYVDSVTNNYSVSKNNIDRTTTLNVSRGMKKPFIVGGTHTLNNGKVVEVKYTYFDIVNAEIIKKNINYKINNTGGEVFIPKNSITTKYGVNEEAFNFYLNKKHLAAYL
ncbi:MAG: hypothetical protein OEL54_05885, partial [Flavobacteriaceae bacterium]|nr:hypothetical protein [Flavobacteriaceae bacterium]